MIVFEKKFDALNLDSVECANYLRYVAAKKFGLNLNMTQVQKLLYMAYGIALSAYKIRLTDERPQAWPFGPIFANVHEYTDFRYIPKKPTDPLPNETVRLFEKLLRKFGKTDDRTLSMWSCNPDRRNPWVKAKPRFFWQKWGKYMYDTDIYYWFKLVEQRVKGNKQKGKSND